MNIYLIFSPKLENYHLNALKKRLFQPLSEESDQYRPDRLTQKNNKEGEKIAKKALSKREKLFCLNYAILPDACEAAANAGYTINPQAAAVKLLSRSDITNEIAALTKTQTPHISEAAAGYRRLAFGSVADALCLIFSEDPPSREELGEMNLFNVAEIKRPKGGGIEIKFFDRLKPLERLAQMSGEESVSGALPFYQALESAAQRIGGAFEDDQ